MGPRRAPREKEKEERVDEQEDEDEGEGEEEEEEGDDNEGDDEEDDEEDAEEDDDKEGGGDDNKPNEGSFAHFLEQQIGGDDNKPDEVEANDSFAHFLEQHVGEGDVAASDFAEAIIKNDHEKKKERKRKENEAARDNKARRTRRRSEASARDEEPSRSRSERTTNEPARTGVQDADVAGKRKVTAEQEERRKYQNDKRKYEEEQLKSVADRLSELPQEFEKEDEPEDDDEEVDPRFEEEMRAYTKRTRRRPANRRLRRRRRQQRVANPKVKRHPKAIIAKLESFFKVVTHPNKLHRHYIASETYLTETQVHWWFQNRRTKAFNCSDREKKKQLEEKEAERRELLQEIESGSPEDAEPLSQAFVDLRQEVGKLQLHNTMLQKDNDNLQNVVRDLQLKLASYFPQGPPAHIPHPHYTQQPSVQYAMPMPSQTQFQQQASPAFPQANGPYPVPSMPPPASGQPIDPFHTEPPEGDEDPDDPLGYSALSDSEVRDQLFPPSTKQVVRGLMAKATKADHAHIEVDAPGQNPDAELIPLV